MRVLFNGTCNNRIGKLSGNFYHMLRLSEALGQLLGSQFKVLADEFTVDAYRTVLSANQIIATTVGRKGTLARELAVLSAVRSWRPTVFHRPTGQLPWIPLPIPSVMTVADLNWRYLPTPWWKRFYKDMSYRASIRRSTAITCISHSTRRDLELNFTDARGLCSVVHHGTTLFHGDVEGCDFTQGKRYFLTFAHQPHKNAETVISALKSVPENSMLVVIGGGSRVAEVLQPLATLDGVADRVVFADRVSDGVLKGLYRDAVGLIFMSRFEGFGLPVLEAMGQGCPVVCSNTTSLPEVAGDAAVLLAPDDVVAISREMSRLLTDDAYRNAFKAAGLKRASEFTWKSAAEQTLKVYQSAVQLWNGSCL